MRGWSAAKKRLGECCARDLRRLDGWGEVLHLRVSVRHLAVLSDVNDSCMGPVLSSSCRRGLGVPLLVP